MVGYTFFAERYQWTPDEVDNLPAYVHARLPVHAAVLDELREDNAHRAAKGAQA